MSAPKMPAIAALVALAAMLLYATPAAAQSLGTVRTTRGAVVMEQPRGDSVQVGRIEAGEELEVLSVRGAWYEVMPAATEKRTWTRGWIHATAIQAPETLSGPSPSRVASAPGRFRIRGFGQAGGSLFTARESFEAILGDAFGAIVGGGAQVVLPNDVFFQVSAERVQETGSRVLVANEQLFTLDADARVTVTPVLVTVGFRAPEQQRTTAYLGGGIGWHQLRETTPGEAEVSERTIGYHVLGGAEYSLGRWLALGGEAQWATVPKAMGESGISAVFGQRNLGGTSFRFKLVVGN